VTLLDELTTQIVTAYMAGNALPANRLPDLLRTVHDALAAVAYETAAPPGLKPAVPISQSVTRGAVTCLECGWSGTMLRRHLTSTHSMPADEYRKKWGLRPDHPLVSPTYARLRSALAKKIGLGRGPHPWRKRRKGI
jgi:predicted transcriptional regulator